MRSDIEQIGDPAGATTHARFTGELDLFPISIIAFGSPTQPVERLMALQSAVSKAVHALTALRLPHILLSLPAWLRLRAH